MTAAGGDGHAADAAGARRYTLLCLALGVALGQLPRAFHGPIAAKFDAFHLHGAIAVWGWTVARSSIGLFVGAATWPAPWWLRGPLFGALALLPLTFVSLAMSNCGWP